MTGKSSTYRFNVVLLVCLATAGVTFRTATAMRSANPPLGAEYENSIGMNFVSIKAGSFMMGRLNSAEGLEPGYTIVVDGGDWDEKPVHKVKIRRQFYIQKNEVTAEQYRQFDSSYSGSGAAVGITWHEAVAFAEWLSKKENKPYRLPTEAEWEYVCRAGTTTLFSSGDSRPAAGEVNPWKVCGMHDEPAEWVHDWHGTYMPDDQVDPVGPEKGIAKVVRGGLRPYEARSASRLSRPPDSGRKYGFKIGLRLVIGDMPKSAPAESIPFSQQCVKQNTQVALMAPNPEKPFFNRRNAMPIPPENDQDDIGSGVGVHPAVLAHNHSPGFVAMANGDLLAVFFSSSTATTEYDINVGFIQARLRFGSLQWDMPETLVTFGDLNAQSALLWNDNGRIWFLYGGRGWPSNIPFKYSTSDDNGASWTQATLPIIEGEPGKYTPQPITGMFRDPDNNIYFTMDGSGKSSLLWRSTDNGITWSDTGGRTEGRHSAVVPIKDRQGRFVGKLLCLGTKKGLYANNWMQQNISRNWGKVWEPKTKAPFPYLSSNQRGCLRRLSSGKLLFVSDHQAREGQQPEGYTEHGAFAAISKDEGRTWHVKTIPGTLPHEGRVINPKRKWTGAGHDYGTVGYVTATQMPNGIINVLTTMNQPCQHFEFNEAWLYSKQGGAPAINPGESGKIQQYSEKYADGKKKAQWSAKTCDDGRYLLHGTETWYYQNGRKQHEVTFENGRKVGTETYWTSDGKKRWDFSHEETGSSVWTHYWPSGRKKSKSTWIDHICRGTATQWDKAGKIVRELKLQDGIMVQ